MAILPLWPHYFPFIIFLINLFLKIEVLIEIPAIIGQRVWLYEDDIEQNPSHTVGKWSIRLIAFSFKQDGEELHGSSRILSSLIPALITPKGRSQRHAVVWKVTNGGAVLRSHLVQIKTSVFTFSIHHDSQGQDHNSLAITIHTALLSQARKQTVCKIQIL